MEAVWDWLRAVPSSSWFWWVCFLVLAVTVWKSMAREHRAQWKTIDARAPEHQDRAFLAYIFQYQMQSTYLLWVIAGLLAFIAWILWKRLPNSN